MTTFFWVAEIANVLSVVVALAALLLVLWLGPRRWTNLSFGLLLCAVILWLGMSAVARLQVNFPPAGDPTPALRLLSLGFALVGVTLFWFAESFAPLPRRLFWLINLIGLAVYSLFTVALFSGQIIGDPRRDVDGGLAFTITQLGITLSVAQYIYGMFAGLVLFRRRMWRNHPYLVIGVALVIATLIIALLIPAVSVQTYIITVAVLCMAYEVIKQQLFNPLIEANQRLEAEVAKRTAELTQSLAEQARVRSELAIARDIQLSLLPRATPQPPQLVLAGRSLPAQEVGGDFFAYHTFADGRLSVAVGDVSGKGIPAALLMAFALRTYEMLAETHQEQGALLTAFNRTLAPRLIQSNMQTAFASMVIDGPGHIVALANAGMITPLLWRDGAVRYLESWGLPLGARTDTRYEQMVVALQPGDLLLLVSDGIVEAMNGQRELWGFPRLEALLAQHGSDTPSDLIDTIFAAIYAHVASAPPHDDMTIVALRLDPQAHVQATTRHPQRTATAHTTAIHARAPQHPRSAAAPRKTGGPPDHA